MGEQSLRRKIYAATTGEDVTAAALIIATAFAGLPHTAWLVPDPEKRISTLRAYFQIPVAHALAHGTVELLSQADGDGCLGGGIGVAVWFDLTEGPAPEPPDYEARTRAATGPDYDRFAHLDLLLDQHHPGWPHHHLAFLAALPGHQDDGIGAALLAHHHELLDDHGAPAYLEASSADSERLYVRHGYTPLGPPFEMTNQAGFQPMRRRPAGPA